MYKILIKYMSKVGVMYWKSHTMVDENGDMIEFNTNSVDILKEELKKLDETYGYDNLRVVIDVPYTVSMAMPNELINVATSEEVTDLYNMAFANVFGGV